jgi:hypothetical protein
VCAPLRTSLFEKDGLDYQIAKNVRLTCAWETRRQAHFRSDAKKAAIELIGGMDGMVACRVSNGSLVPMTQGSGRASSPSTWRQGHPV